MATPINTIYSWFETGDFPTQEQFHASWSSFWHKDETIPMTTIDGLSDQFGKYVLVSTFNSHLKDENAHSTYLAKRDASNLTPTNVNDWKAKLGVGDLPENIATYDYDIHNQVMMKDGTTTEATDLGKHIANSSLTSVAGAGLTLGSSWTLNTNGQLYSVTNLPDKSADASFNRMIVQNSTGQVAWGNGANMLITGMTAMSDEQKLNLRRKALLSTESYSTGQAVISSVNPPIILQNPNYTQYVSLIGSNLFIDPTSTQAQIKIIAPNGTETLINNFTTAQSNPNILTFPIASGQFPTGDYTFKIFNNGVWSAINSQAVLRVRDVITELPLPNINWEVKNIDGTTPSVYTGGAISNNSYMTSATSCDLYSTSITFKIFSQGDFAITPQMMSNGLLIKCNIAAKIPIDYSGGEYRVGLSSTVFDYASTFDFILEFNSKNSLFFHPANYRRFIGYNSNYTDKLYIIIKDGQITMGLQGMGIFYTQSIDASKTYYIKMSTNNGGSTAIGELKLKIEQIYSLS